MNFDDVERRSGENHYDGEERRRMSWNEHHGICKENTVALKEYVCLKMKPLLTSLERQWKVILVIAGFILASGAWTGIETWGNNVRDNDIEHIQKEHVDFKQDVAKKIDGVNDKIDRVEIRINKRLDEKTEAILKAIEDLKK